MVEKLNRINEANSNGGKEHEALVIISGDQILTDVHCYKSTNLTSTKRVETLGYPMTLEQWI